ncbi:NUDIX domain-containing protein [Massilia sp. Root335]|uniref:NUDIX domain-containing protein n=1 Tax=Massilia sp. Root335 TaxID=1736517 RepID=UPI0006F56DC9|nr:NUDIX domain-containing protein [Massilia sp. Root335]KQV27186.1 GDP-mannose pyrophosphatase [Massilia sp. Root335]
MSSDTVRIVREEILSDHYLPLKNVTYALRRHDGDLQVQSREVYDSADGAAVLLYNRTHRSVVLTRQFRVGARLAGHDGFLLEAAAGMLDGADPATRALAEVREETGYDIERVQPALQLYASPASTTERVHLFVAEYERERRRDGGGGNAEEGEDIEVVELDFDDALAMVETGDIVDAKTVLLLMYLERKVLGRHGEAS